MPNPFHGHYMVVLTRLILTQAIPTKKTVPSTVGHHITSLMQLQNPFKTSTRTWMDCLMSGQTSGE